MCKKFVFLTSIALIFALAGANATLGAVVWEGRVSEGQDDWEQNDPGGMRSSTSSDLEMPYEDTGKGDKQIVGIRFQDVRIPKNANISNAYIEFTCDETKDGTLPVSLLIEGEASPDATPFSDSDDVASRSRTAAMAIWEPVDWTAAGQVDQTSDISAIIQDIVNMDGWASGNSLVIIISDNPENPSEGIRCAESFNGTADQAALLHVESTTKFAHNPNPADGSLVEDTWVSISWGAGETAVSHDVYLSDNLNDVIDGTGDAVRGNQVATELLAGFPGNPYPEGLVPGTTYYWRIDEVEADGTTKYEGPVWSFSIPPKTAYNPDPADGAEFVGPENVILSWTPGFGAKLHTVFFGESYDEVNNATVGIMAGIPSHNVGTLEAEKVYYWRIDEFDPPGTYKGDVWSFTTPGAVGNPQPAFDAEDVQMNVILSWTAATSAASHELYFGTDKDAVRNAAAGAPEYIGSKDLGAESHDPGLLDPDTTYYWRVDEVDDQGNTSTGPLWIFTTGGSLLVDDFEGYTDDDTAGEAIWQTWIDGFGIADNGAQVGYLMPPYAEQTLVHGGAQSMPLLYVNEDGVTNSEASMTLAATRDWTLAGVEELSFWFRGAMGNAAEPLYVSIANTAGAPATVAYDDAEAATSRSWNEWSVPLQTLADQGIDLGNVDKIAIGLGSKGGASVGGSGTIYIDDIRLNQP